jgi:hypothetical protein
MAENDGHNLYFFFRRIVRIVQRLFLRTIPELEF